MPRWITVLLAIFTAAAVAAERADSPQPRSPQAKSAMKTAANRIANAEGAFHAAKTRVLEDEIDALNAAKATAMRDNDLDEANAIATEVKEVKDELSGESSQVGKTALTEALANAKWHLEGGNATVRYRPDGTVTIDPNPWGGKFGSWIQVGPNSIEVHEPQGTTVLVTFMPDRLDGFWQYSDNPAHHTAWISLIAPN
jgi:hypothetical protein